MKEETMDHNTELPNSILKSAAEAKPPETLTRREFGPRAAVALAGIMLLPRHVLGGRGYAAPSEKLNIAGVGVGGMGGVSEEPREREHRGPVRRRQREGRQDLRPLPNAKTYRDFRELLDKEKGIDAVVIGTPDHTHAVVAMAALQLGKHVYCAKPMTRTIYEARKVVAAAREAKVATQMSVQSCASEEAALRRSGSGRAPSGKCGKCMSGPIARFGRKGSRGRTTQPPVPSTFDWDLWLGPAPERPYHPVYHPFRWRGWHDFGTGSLGDMGCHTFHVIWQALRLEPPTRVQACCEFHQCCPPMATDADEAGCLPRKRSFRRPSRCRRSSLGISRRAANCHRSRALV